MNADRKPRQINYGMIILFVALSLWVWGNLIYKIDPSLIGLKMILYLGN